MKTIISAIIFLCILTEGVAQTILKPYIGINYSNAKYHLINNQSEVDSASWKGDWIPLLKTGMDVQMKLNDNFYLISGLGVSWLGSKNYSTFEPMPNREIPPNLIIGYIDIPCIVKYNLFKSIGFYGGVYLEYSFRKNQNMFATDSMQVVYKTNNTCQVAAAIGITYDAKPFFLELGLYQGLIRIYDTKEINTDKRAYLNISAFQLKLGYLLEDKAE